MVQEGEELRGKATQGEWYQDVETCDEEGIYDRPIPTRSVRSEDMYYVDWARTPEDAAFIVHAANHLPVYAKALREMDAEVKQLQEQHFYDGKTLERHIEHINQQNAEIARLRAELAQAVRLLNEFGVDWRGIPSADAEAAMSSEGGGQGPILTPCPECGAPFDDSKGPHFWMNGHEVCHKCATGEGGEKRG
jgi:hypothetical protein